MHVATKARALVGVGNIKAAVQVFEYGLGPNSPPDAATNEKGNLLRSVQRYSEALSAYNQATQRNPGNPAKWFWRAMVLCQLGRVKEAIASSDRALQLDPQNSRLWSVHGTLLYTNHQYAQALEAHDRTLTINQTNMEAHLGRAMALWGLKRLGKLL